MRKLWLATPITPALKSKVEQPTTQKKIRGVKPQHHVSSWGDN
ncbi:MAG: hypothetical protein QF412_11550 [Planctomycetota bacterium]|nr:hypothetical protein [Planctomycetota bacterium]